MPAWLPRQWPILVVVGVLVLGATLRFWTIGAGLPYAIGVDEPVIMDKSIHMIREGDFNPHFFHYPGLTYYLQAAVASARFLAGAMDREWTSLRDVWAGDFYLWARAATAALGTLTVLLTFRAGLRWGFVAGLLAMLAMAVQPQHVRESHFALTDVPMTFFVALSLVQSLSAAQRPKPSEFFLAGLACGLAAATKYNAALTILMPLCAASSLRAIRPFVHVVTALIGGAAAGFLIGAPYSLLDLPGFLNGFAELMQYYNAHSNAAEGMWVYGTYIAQWFSWPGVLWVSVAIPALVVCGIGVVALGRQVLDATTRPMALVLLVFPVVYFWFIASQSQSLRFGRYALPLVPFLSIWFGLGAARLIDAAPRWQALARVRHAQALVAAALVLLLAPPLGASVVADLRRRVTSPTLDAAKWLLDNVKPGEGVAIEGRAYLQLPPHRVKVLALNSITEKSLVEFERAGIVYLVASSAEYDKFLRNPRRYLNESQAYTAIFASTQAVQIFPSTDHNQWPTIRIQRIIP